MAYFGSKNTMLIGLKGGNGKSAYEQAVEGGYTGTEAQFNEAIAAINNMLTHILNTNNPHSVSKSQVGLGNVPNTDCTNASNITSGTLNENRLPNGISVSKGGTGRNTLTVGYVLIGNGTSDVDLRPIYNMTSVGQVGTGTDLITKNTLYNHQGNTNLKYCAKGTFGTASVKDSTNSVTNGGTELPTSGAVYNAINNAVASTTESVTLSSTWNAILGGDPFEASQVITLTHNVKATQRVSIVGTDATSVSDIIKYGLCVLSASGTSCTIGCMETTTTSLNVTILIEGV